MRFSIVIPVYNSTQSLIELTDRLHQVMNPMGSYEIIFVDDFSENPETWNNLKKLSDQPQVSAVQLTRNFGKAGAVLCGMNEAKGEFVVTIDDDLQHAPEDIPVLFDGLKEYDVVIGRFKNKKHGPFKRLTSSIKNWFDYKLIGKPKGIRNGPFKIFRREIVDAMINIQAVHPYIAALLFYTTKNVTNVDVEHHPRKEGKSGFTTKKRVGSFWNLLFNNSSWLLKSLATFGFLLSIISFGGGIYYFVRKLIIKDVVSGFTTTIIVILFSTGIILLALGILGEYLSRTISLSEKKPSYIIRTKAGDEAS